MRDRSGFPNPLDIEREDRERDEWERERRRYQDYERGGDPRYDERYARSERDYDDRWRDEPDEGYARDRETWRDEPQREMNPPPRRRRFGRYYGMRGMEGVGSAAGYAGFGGSGWTGGGFGDPGYNTSGFDSADYGTSRSGGGRLRRSLPVRFASERPYLSEFRGPHAGKGPKGYQRSDERVREEVCERLTRDHQIDASEVEIEVANGEVTLSGNVPEREMKWMAEDVTESVFGVDHVVNRIKVSPEGK